MAGELFGLNEGFLFRARPVIAATEISRALPEPAVLSLVDVQLAVHERMSLCRHRQNPKLCNTCVRVSRASKNVNLFVFINYLLVIFSCNQLLSPMRLPISPFGRRERRLRL